MDVICHLGYKICSWTSSVKDFKKPQTTPKHNPNQNAKTQPKPKKQPEREKLQMILLSIFKKTAHEKIL